MAEVGDAHGGEAAGRRTWRVGRVSRRARPHDPSELLRAVATASRTRLACPLAGSNHMRCCSERRALEGAAVGSSERLRLEYGRMLCCSRRRALGGAAVVAGKRLRLGCVHMP
eukprot:SAG22_NODE_1013_length_6027_cov_4.804318_4_plen_113_part_00